MSLARVSEYRICRRKKKRNGTEWRANSNLRERKYLDILPTVRSGTRRYLRLEEVIVSRVFSWSFLDNALQSGAETPIVKFQTLIEINQKRKAASDIRALARLIAE